MGQVGVKSMVLGMVLGMAFSLLAIGEAEAVVVLCKKGSKPLKVREGACKSKETQVPASELGVVGPQGDPGLPGAPGAPGEAGARGPSNGRFFSSGDDILDFVADTEQNVASLALSAGNWVITAKVIPNSNDIVDISFGCSLQLGGVTIDSIYGIPAPSLGLDLEPNNDRDVGVMTAAGTLAADGTVDVVCLVNSASGNWGRRSITAIQVETLN